MEQVGPRFTQILALDARTYPIGSCIGNLTI